MLRRLYRTLYGPFFKASKVLSRRGLYPFLEGEFGRIESGSQVLSIGAGGEVNRRLQSRREERNFNVVELDIDPARQPDVVADICSWREPEKFDVIVASEVLEHVNSPQAAMENLHSSLKRGGRLILTTPFVFPIHQAPRDFYRYTRYGLEHLLRDFDDVVIEERNSWAEAILVLLARSNKSGHRGLGLFSPLLIGAALVAVPMAWLAAGLFPADFLTTGYNATAVRGGPEGVTVE